MCASTSALLASLDVCSTATARTAATACRRQRAAQSARHRCPRASSRPNTANRAACLTGRSATWGPCVKSVAQPAAAVSVPRLESACLRGPRVWTGANGAAMPRGSAWGPSPRSGPRGESVLPSDAVPPPAGALSVSDSGVASYVIPLTLPDGASGHRPELDVVYNSTAGDGVLGRGWSLGG